MDAASVNIAGLLLAFVGILLLFRHGMPNQMRTDGEFGVAREAEPNTEKWDVVLGWIGLILVVFATLVIPAFMR
jgi:drug/metabolite transporter (DMT)-like permease